MWFYGYCVTFWEEVEKKMITVTGTTCGETFIEATKRVIDYYGDTNIDKLSLEVIEDSEYGIMEGRDESDCSL